MPHLRIYGIPPEATQVDLETLTEMLQWALANMSALGIKKENVFIFYPADRMTKGLGEEVICDAVLFNAPLRTRAVRRKFAETVAMVIQQFFPESIVKCMAFNFDRSMGYSTRDPIKKEGGK